MLLPLQKRLGFGNNEIDDFLAKATAVEEAIKGMRDGTVDPATVKIEGIETDEERLEKEVRTGVVSRAGIGPYYWSIRQFSLQMYHFAYPIVSLLLTAEARGAGPAGPRAPGGAGVGA